MQHPRVFHRRQVRARHAPCRYRISRRGAPMQDTLQQALPVHLVRLQRGIHHREVQTRQRRMPRHLVLVRCNTRRGGFQGLHNPVYKKKFLMVDVKRKFWTTHVPLKLFQPVFRTIPALPKSISQQWSPFELRMTFSSLISRCTIPRLCRNAIASAIWPR